MIYDIVGEYNNTYHETIKMKLVDVGDGEEILLLSIMKSLMKMIMSGFQNLKMYLLKDMHLIGVKKFLLLKK